MFGRFDSSCIYATDGRSYRLPIAHKTALWLEIESLCTKEPFYGCCCCCYCPGRLEVFREEPAERRTNEGLRSCCDCKQTPRSDTNRYEAAEGKKNQRKTQTKVSPGITPSVPEAPTNGGIKSVRRGYGISTSLDTMEYAQTDLEQDSRTVIYAQDLDL